MFDIIEMLFPIMFLIIVIWYTILNETCVGEIYEGFL